MDADEQLRVVDKKIEAAIDYARNELSLNYASIIGLLHLHIAELTAEALDTDES